MARVYLNKTQQEIKEAADKVKELPPLAAVVNKKKKSLKPKEKKVQVNEHTGVTYSCGQCPETFDSYDKYLDHHCPTMNCTPRDPQYMGEGYEKIQAAALERGSNQKND